MRRIEDTDTLPGQPNVRFEYPVGMEEYVIGKLSRLCLYMLDNRVFKEGDRIVIDVWWRHDLADVKSDIKAKIKRYGSGVARTG